MANPQVAFKEKKKVIISRAANFFQSRLSSSSCRLFTHLILMQSTSNICLTHVMCFGFYFPATCNCYFIFAFPTPLFSPLLATHDATISTLIIICDLQANWRYPACCHNTFCAGCQTCFQNLFIMSGFTAPHVPSPLVRLNKIYTPHTPNNRQPLK